MSLLHHNSRNSRSRMGRTARLAGLALTLSATLATPGHAFPSSPQTAPIDSTIPQQVLLQPAQLNEVLKGPHKPLILQVGSHTLFTEAHISGSEYAGAGGTPAGLETLRQRVASLPKSAPVVLYCGCCPWGRCPDIRPAYRALHDLGFSDVKVLYLADNLGANWIDKGYPVDRGR